MRVGLGVDGSASNNASNLMQEVRAAFLLQRCRYGVEKVSHKDALRWATEGSAACIGRPELGPDRRRACRRTLRCSRWTNCASPARWTRSPRWSLCGAHRADRVMVGGRWVVEDGAIPGLDMAALVRRHTAAAKALHAE